MNSAIIVAGGTGKRIAKDIPKQFIKIAGKEILTYSVKTFLNHPQRAHMMKVDLPQDGDAVFMTKFKRPAHVGVYLQTPSGGKIAHCEINNGVICQDEKKLKACGWHIEGYYRFKKD